MELVRHDYDGPTEDDEEPPRGETLEQQLKETYEQAEFDSGGPTPAGFFEWQEQIGKAEHKRNCQIKQSRSLKGWCLSAVVHLKDGLGLCSWPQDLLVMKNVQADR